MCKDRTWFSIGKKLAGEASADELSELEGLLRSDPDMHYALQNITDLWSLSSPVNNDAAEAVNRHVKKLIEATKDWDLRNESPEDQSDNTTSQKRSRKKILIMSMAVAVFMISSVYWYKAVTKRLVPTSPALAAQTAEKNEVSTQNGSKATINLPDGSIVWLNAGSVLTYDKNFGGDPREVALRGEAYFEVIPAITPGTTQKIPFVIHTKQIDFRVLSTAFNVKAYPGYKQTETSLVHGKVEVSLDDRPEKKITLQPNEKLIVLNDASKASATENNSTSNNQAFVSISKLTYAAADSLVIETAWVQNKLVFDNESFLEIAEKMERWYNVEIVFNDVKKQKLHSPAALPMKPYNRRWMV